MTNRPANAIPVPPATVSGAMKPDEQKTVCVPEPLFLQVVEALTGLDAHYLGSLDHQPDYVARCRAAFFALSSLPSLRVQPDDDQALTVAYMHGFAAGKASVKEAKE